MDEDLLQYRLTRDTFFKTFFYGEDKQYLLRHLVESLLNIPPGNEEEFHVFDQEIPPDYLSLKTCRLDFFVQLGQRLVVLEVQVKDEGDFPARSEYYWARVFSHCLSLGEKYSSLPEVYFISITDFELSDSQTIPAKFKVLNTDTHTPLSDNITFLYYELPKWSLEMMRPDDPAGLWISLFFAKRYSHLDLIDATGVEIMQKATTVFRNVSKLPQFSFFEVLRHMGEADAGSSLRHAVEAECAKLEAAAQEERAKLEEERANERAKLAEERANERAKLEEERANERAKLAEERAKLAEERAKLEEERANARANMELAVRATVKAVLENERAKLDEERATLDEERAKLKKKSAKKSTQKVK